MYMYRYRLHCWLVVAIVVLLGAACTSEARVDKSPLATWGPRSGEALNDATVGNGILDVSAGCVRLILKNQKTILLVWPEPTSWNASSQTIAFVGVRGERAELRDGDRIIPGGSTPIVEPPFVSPPDPSCKADETFMVNSLILVTD